MTYHRRTVVLGLVGILLTAGASAQDEPSFTLGIDAPESVAAPPGEAAAFHAFATITTSGLGESDPGAQGWSLSIASDACRIVEATVAGTVAAEVGDDPPGLRSGGFEKTEITTSSAERPDNDGVVSAVILGVETRVELPPTGTHAVISLFATTEIPGADEDGGPSRLIYRDGLVGSGQPVNNRVAWQDSTFFPEQEAGSGVVERIAASSCAASGVPLAVAFLGEALPGGQIGDPLSADRIGSLEIQADGTTAEGSVWVALASQLHFRGVQAWSLSIAVSDEVAIVGATTDGTAGAPAGDGSPGLRNDGFEKTEIVDPELGSQGPGVISALVLSYSEPIELLPTGLATALRLDIAASDAVVGEPTEGSVFLRDGLVGSGQPVRNIATVAGATERFCAVDDQRLDVTFSPAADCALEGVPLAVTFLANALPGGQISDPLSDLRIESTEIAAGIGAVAQGTAWVGIASQLPGTGVQGWSLSIGLTDELSVTDATTDGTAGADVSASPPGVRSNGFEKTELVDPNVNSQGQGVVSAVVLSFTEAIYLDSVGLASVLRIDFDSSEPVGEEPVSGSVFFADGYVGSGQPVKNAATVEGQTETFCALAAQRLEVAIVELDVAPFIPGDSNADGRLDIADAIWIINELFRDGPVAPCPDAADANEDDLYDLSDATFMIEYLFMSGSAPSRLVCEKSESSTSESCPAGSTVCP